MKNLAFFNNKGGVGKTSLVYHLGWTFAEMGYQILMVDLDPQSNLTAMCVDEERLLELWTETDAERKTIRGAVEPIVDGIGDIQPAHLELLTPRLALLPGDIRLSDFETKLSDAWPRCLDGDKAAFRTASSFQRIVTAAAERHGALLVLIDVGPNLGAINRAALIAADYLITPIGADLFSIQGLRNLGPTLQRWRKEWKERLDKMPIAGLELPLAAMSPIGYVVMQPNLYAGQVTQAYGRWLEAVPSEYAAAVLQQESPPALTIEQDDHHLAVLKHYRSLMPMAQTVRKPIFKLTAADGAIGSHAEAVQRVGKEFRSLAHRIADRIQLSTGD